MRFNTVSKIISSAFMYVINTNKLYSIDESHALGHSMDVFYYANQIYENEVIKKPSLNLHKNIIDMSAILHDTCDKKYMDEKTGLNNIKKFLDFTVSNEETDVILNIISKMSYSTVKKNGFPDIGEYQLAYNIVREADLLSAYDIDCIMASV